MIASRAPSPGPLWLCVPMALTGCAGGNDAASLASSRAVPVVAQPGDAILAAAYDVPADGRFAITVNGQPLTAIAGPGLPSEIGLTGSDAATLFGPARAEGARGRTNRVGPVNVMGWAQPAAVSFPFGAQRTARQPRRWVAWYDRDTLPGGQAALGPWAIPASIVRFQLRAPSVGEQSFRLPLDPAANDWGVASTSLPVGDVSVRFALAPQFARTTASASAGGAIGRLSGGVYDGAAQDIAITYGVRRPARPVRLSTPLALGPLRIGSLLVRTRDYGSAAGVVDPSEDDGRIAGDIVVRAARARMAPANIVYIGAADLAACSSITFDKPAQQIILVCRPPA